MQPTASQAKSEPKPKLTILQGDCRERLRQLPEQSIHCCLTSPPYYAMRTYSTAPQIWDGNPNCNHDWVYAPQSPTKLSMSGNTQGEYGGGIVNAAKVYANCRPTGSGLFCTKCNAWRGELGHEPSPGLYVDHLVAIFSEVYRVLRDDGVLFLNLGDTYARIKQTGRMDCDLAAGNLIGIPWRTAFALQDFGWILRSDIIWDKKNPMPESVRSRPTRAHEFVFIFSKTMDYFWDADAIREPCVSGNGKPQGIVGGKRFGGRANAKGLASGYGSRLMINPTNGRNARDVWTLAAQPFRGSHCATMPVALAERCIRAGTSERGCCSGCGMPWVRSNDESLLWLPGCDCDLGAIPCTVLDVFGGAATTLLAGAKLGRSAIGIELNPEYCEQGAKRIQEKSGQEVLTHVQTQAV